MMTTTSIKAKPKTPDQVKALLNAQGLTVKQWAIDNNYPVPEVYKIMSGERQGLYGRGYEIAAKLGLAEPQAKYSSGLIEAKHEIKENIKETIIEIFTEGSYQDAFHAGAKWIANVTDCEQITIEVTPTEFENHNKVIVKYTLKEQDHD